MNKQNFYRNNLNSTRKSAGRIPDDKKTGSHTPGNKKSGSQLPGNHSPKDPISGSRLPERLLLVSYIFAELILLLAIKYAEIHLPLSIQKRLMFGAISLNTLLVLCYYVKYGRKLRGRIRLIAFALITTWFADLFLTRLGMVLPGYLLFCLVELLYAAYLMPAESVHNPDGLSGARHRKPEINRKPDQIHPVFPCRTGWVFPPCLESESCRRNILIRTLIYPAVLLLLYPTGLITINNAFGLLNLTLLGVNVICAWRAALHLLMRTPKLNNVELDGKGTLPKSDSEVSSITADTDSSGENLSLVSIKLSGLLFAIGMTLFAGCDYSLLLVAICSGTAAHIASFLVWIFYIPAQVLLVLHYCTCAVACFRPDNSV